MTDQELIAVCTRDWKAAVWGSVPFLFIIFVIIAVLVRQQVASALGTGEILAVLVVSLGATLLATVVLIKRYKSAGPVTFYSDHVSFDGSVLAYEDIALVIHKDADTSEEAVGNFDTGFFELFAPGIDVLRFRHVKNPEEVRQVLADNVSSPADQLSENPPSNPGSGGRELLDTREQFWDYWRADRAVPETAVVPEETFKDVLAVDSYSLELVDTVDMTGRQGLSDISQNDVTVDSGRADAGTH